MDELEQKLRQAVANNFFERYQNVFKTNSEAMSNEFGMVIKEEFDKKVRNLLKTGKIGNAAAAKSELTLENFKALASMMLIQYPTQQKFEWEQGKELYRKLYKRIVHENFPSTFEMLMQYMQRKDNIINFLIPQGNSILVPSENGLTIGNEILGFAMNWEFKSKDDYSNSHKARIEVASAMNDIFEDIAKKKGQSVLRFKQNSFEMISKYYLQADLEAFF